MEVNGSGGRLDRKTSKEKSVKKKSTKEKGKQPEAWNRANHRVESMVLYVRQDVSGRTYKIILSGLPAVGDGLFHSWSGRSCTAFRLAQMDSEKEKQSEIRKSTSLA